MDSIERKMLADELKRYHDCAFTPGVYEHSIVGQAALILENYVEVVRCEDCDNTCPGSNGLVCTAWGARTDPDGWCYKAERKDNGLQTV